MSYLISKVLVNAFYYPKPEQDFPKMMRGYLKATVSNKTETEHGRKWASNPYFPVFFVPFIIRDREYSLQCDLACTALDVTPSYQNISQIRWEMVPLKQPERERPRLEAIISKLDSGLPEIMQHTRPLKNRKRAQCLSFLGQFPKPLREGIDERAMYGTIDGRKIEYFIHEHELSTYAGEDRIQVNRPPRGKQQFIVKQFYRQ